jgi:hypothetical protein
MRTQALVILGAIIVPATPAELCAARVDVETTKTYYELGETVEFTVTNNLTETIWLNGYPYWRAIEDASGEHMAPCVGLPMIYPMSSGASESDRWSQINCHTGEPVAPGLYWIQVKYWTDSDPTVRIAHAAFCIGDGCDLPTAVQEAVLTAPWGFVKGRYR